MMWEIETNKIYMKNVLFWSTVVTRLTLNLKLDRYASLFNWFGLVWFRLQYGLCVPVRSVCVVPDTLWWSSSSSILWSKSTSTLCSTLCLSLTLSLRRSSFSSEKREFPGDKEEERSFWSNREKDANHLESFVCYLLLSLFFGLFSLSFFFSGFFQLMICILKISFFLNCNCVGSSPLSWWNQESLSSLLYQKQKATFRIIQIKTITLIKSLMMMFDGVNMLHSVI